MVGGIYLYRRTGQLGLVFPRLPRDYPKAYDERTASGRSMTRWWQRYGGANRVLHVTVVDEEVWIRVLLFGFLAHMWGLLHRFNVRQVRKAERVNRWMVNVALVYDDDKRGTQTLELRLRDPDAFLEAVARAFRSRSAEEVSPGGDGIAGGPPTPRGQV